MVQFLSNFDSTQVQVKIIWLIVSLINLANALEKEMFPNDPKCSKFCQIVSVSNQNF